MLNKKMSLAALLGASSLAAVALAATTFSDVPADHWAASSISWVNDSGIMTGPGEAPGTFDPAGAVNRAQLATVSERLYKKVMEDVEKKMTGEKADDSSNADMSEGTIKAAIMDAQNLTTLAEALEAAELLDMFDGEEKYTVFAPADSAFAALGDAEVEELLKPENKEALVELLSLHVVKGEYQTTDLEEGMTMETLAGQKVEFSFNENGKWMVDEAQIDGADVQFTNGILHVIGAVLKPLTEAEPA